jgi:hypothetical protein
MLREETHFLEVLNRSANTQPEVDTQLKIHETYEERGDERINIGEPTKAEIRLGLKSKRMVQNPEWITFHQKYLRKT